MGNTHIVASGTLGNREGNCNSGVRSGILLCGAGAAIVWDFVYVVYTPKMWSEISLSEVMAALQQQGEAL